MREYHKQWREKNSTKRAEKAKEYRIKNPDKTKAHYSVNNRIYRGLIKKQPCEKCGSIENINAHHDNYTKPLEVRWLCCTCHRAEHPQPYKKRIRRHDSWEMT